LRIIKNLDELKTLDTQRDGGDLVLVPTMGALHQGHLSLVEQARGLGQVVVSIFVNPTQFGPNEDFDRYPRDLQADLDLLAPLAPAVVFAPDVSQMYTDPDGARVQPGRFAEGLCGAGRAGHFAGVLTVVAKLFNLVRPDVAVFGRKDAQQFLVIAEMVRSLNMPVRLIDAPTVREADGLAMSSRNRYLSPAERDRALALSRALNAARDSLIGGMRNVAAVEAVLISALAGSVETEYVAIRSLPDYVRPEALDGKILIALAARVGATRLIDNIVLDITPTTVQESSLLGDINA
jgi:pantoate--beta-alanine ligase